MTECVCRGSARCPARAVAVLTVDRCSLGLSKGPVLEFVSVGPTLGFSVLLSVIAAA